MTNTHLLRGLVAALAIGVATTAIAMPTGDAQGKAISAQFGLTVRTASAFAKAQRAETDPRGVEAFCLEADHDTLAGFFAAGINLQGLVDLAGKMKDPADLAAVQFEYTDALDKFKVTANIVANLLANEPADCKALPFYTANAPLFATLGNQALALLGLFSL